MNPVDGATTFPVLVRNNASLARSEDTFRCMEAVSRGNLAAVVARNLSMTRSLRAVDALLLVLTGGKGSITQWVHAEYIVGSETIRPPFTQQVRGGYFLKIGRAHV